MRRWLWIRQVRITRWVRERISRTSFMRFNSSKNLWIMMIWVVRVKILRAGITRLWSKIISMSVHRQRIYSIWRIFRALKFRLFWLVTAKSTPYWLRWTNLVVHRISKLKSTRTWTNCWIWLISHRGFSRRGHRAAMTSNVGSISIATAIKMIMVKWWWWWRTLTTRIEFWV